MPEALSAVLAAEGIAWLLLAIAAAGLVRGFSGFGTALVFMPVAAVFLEPATAIAVLAVTELGSAVVLVPRAWALAERREVAVLSAAALAAVPLGVAGLLWFEAATVRWAVVLAAAVTLAALVAGWRYRARIGLPGQAAVGAAAGALGGMTGLTGPPVILFYLAGPGGAVLVRANTILFLAVLDIGILAGLLAAGLIDGRALALGLVLFVPYLVCTALGQRLFDPALETLYRRVAYVVIALAILAGLPLFD